MLMITIKPFFNLLQDIKKCMLQIYRSPNIWPDIYWLSYVEQAFLQLPVSST